MFCPLTITITIAANMMCVRCLSGYVLKYESGCLTCYTVLNRPVKNQYAALAFCMFMF